MRVNLFGMAMIPGVMSLAQAVIMLGMMMFLREFLGSAASDSSGVWTVAIFAQTAAIAAGCGACVKLGRSQADGPPAPRWARPAIWVLVGVTLAMVGLSAQIMSAQQIALTLGLNIAFAIAAAIAVVLR